MIEHVSLLGKNIVCWLVCGCKAEVPCYGDDLLRGEFCVEHSNMNDVPRMVDECSAGIKEFLNQRCSARIAEDDSWAASALFCGCGAEFYGDLTQFSTEEIRFAGCIAHRFSPISPDCMHILSAAIKVAITYHQGRRPKMAMEVDEETGVAHGFPMMPTADLEWKKAIKNSESWFANVKDVGVFTIRPIRTKSGVTRWRTTHFTKPPSSPDKDGQQTWVSDNETRAKRIAENIVSGKDPYDDGQDGWAE